MSLELKKKLTRIKVFQRLEMAQETWVSIVRARVKSQAWKQTYVTPTWSGAESKKIPGGLLASQSTEMASPHSDRHFVQKLRWEMIEEHT